MPSILAMFGGWGRWLLLSLPLFIRGLKVPTDMQRFLKNNSLYIVGGVLVWWWATREKRPETIDEANPKDSKSIDAKLIAGHIAKCLGEHPDQSFIDSRKLFPDTGEVLKLLIQLKEHIPMIEQWYKYWTGTDMIQHIEEKFSLTERQKLFNETA